GSRQSRARVKTAPSTPYTITALVLIDVGYTNFAAAGLCWRESGTGKMIYLDYIANAFILEQGRETNETTFNASTATRQFAQWQPIFLRLNDTGSNIVTAYSLDGVNFITLNTEGRTAFMAGGPNQVGLHTMSDGTGVAPRMSVLSWIET